MSAELYKGFYVKSGDSLYEFQNPTAKDSVDKQIIDKLYANGVSGDRPTSATAQTGEQYFDTDYGVPIFWNGTAWQNATGSTSAVA